MKKFIAWLEVRAPFAALVLGIVPMALVAIAPLAFLLANILPDDAFYYFEIARNITLGLGSTFDGAYPTNGYHPLWMLLLIPAWDLFSVGGALDVAPIRAALVLLVGLAFLTMLALQRVFSRYTQDPLSIACATLLWAWNPFVVYGFMNGLETGLTLFLISVFLLAIVRWSEKMTMARLLTIGVVGGLMMLARLDTVLYFVAALVWLLWRYKKSGMRYALGVGFVATVVVLPFMVWNYSQFSMLLTSASVTSSAVNHELVVQDNGHGFLVLAKARVYTMVRGIEDVVLQTGAPLYFLVLFGLGIGWVWFGKGRDALFAWVKDVPPETILFLGFVLHFFVSTAVRLTYRDWYFLPSTILVAIITVWLLGSWRKYHYLPAYVMALGLIVVVGMYGVVWDRYVEGREVAQLNMFAAAQYTNEHIPEGAVIGVFNAGVQGYFSTHRVVNLDGLVNNAASEAMLERRLWDFIQNDAHIEYVSDYPLYLSYRYKPFFGVEDPFTHLTEIKEISEVGAHARGEGIHIYRVDRAIGQ